MYDIYCNLIEFVLHAMGLLIMLSGTVIHCMFESLEKQTLVMFFNILKFENYKLELTVFIQYIVLGLYFSYFYIYFYFIL